MKRLFIGSLSFLLVLSAAGSSVRAQTTNPIAQSGQTNVTTMTSYSLTPFQLVNLAQGGTFQKQGIPGNMALVSAYKFGKVDANVLVKAGIAAGKVSPDALNNKEYMNAVASYLDLLNKG